MSEQAPRKNEQQSRYEHSIETFESTLSDRIMSIIHTPPNHLGEPHYDAARSMAFLSTEQQAEAQSALAEVIATNLAAGSSSYYYLSTLLSAVDLETESHLPLLVYEYILSKLDQLADHELGGYLSLATFIPAAEQPLIVTKVLKRGVGTWNWRQIMSSLKKPGMANPEQYQDMLFSQCNDLLSKSEIGLRSDDLVDLFRIIPLLSESQRASLEPKLSELGQRLIQTKPYDAVRIIESLSPEQRTELAIDIYRNLHYSPKSEMIDKLTSLPLASRTQVLDAALKNPGSPLTFAQAVMSIPLCDEADQVALFACARAQRTSSETGPDFQNPLYENLAPGRLRGTFDKEHGLKTTVFGGPLYNEVILREMTLANFLHWKKAYEAKDTWTELGFTHIPIEPIVRLRESENLKPHRIDVFSGVIGPTLNQWLRQYPHEHLEHLASQHHRIMRGLAKLGIDHGHPHASNFCVRMHTDEPDPSIPPDLYLIDFDKAGQLKSQPN